MSGIQFATRLTDDKGDEIDKATPLTAEQLQQLVDQTDLPAVRKFLSTMVDRAKSKWTLEDACCDALNAPLESDRGQDLEAILKRGKLITKIREGAKNMTPLTLSPEDITMVKKRIGHHFTGASFVLSVCVLLDPTVVD